jgi:predicted patatin/cPLA2 family phospholipase
VRSDSVQLSAIVVEGGAMRGIFAAGVLDVFHEQGFHPFDLAIGASAGACNLSSHLAGQHERNRRCYLTQMRRVEFSDARRFARGGHWLDIDYLWDAFDREDPLDVAAAAAHRTRLIVAATDVTTGEPAYLEPDATTLSETLRASSAVPILFRKLVELDGRPFTDGGVAAPIPVEEAYRRGARRILVIRSRPRRHPGPSRLECAFAAAILRKHPGLSRAFLRYREVYARSVAFVEQPPADCQVVHVAPPRAFRTTRTTRDARILEADYTLGRGFGAQAIQEWTARFAAAPARSA